ncbi:Aste57867_1268 [Aphanomyces stellatus]|uniref:Aste57867_1268 protein n=1 Tax=Aphanomyces stellatus TaxID=120398 RepID=A0A485K570_9STRA|nr:hypothetical protein As57867_001267 [Aphanomyces stellatus]VFT78487.1 Aste57867_1268 [Aphanomyces stellatus]
MQPKTSEKKLSALVKWWAKVFPVKTHLRHVSKSPKTPIVAIPPKYAHDTKPHHFVGGKRIPYLPSQVRQCRKLRVLAAFGPIDERHVVQGTHELESQKQVVAPVEADQEPVVVDCLLFM